MSDQKRLDIVKKLQDFVAKGEANRGYNSYNKYKKRPNKNGVGGKLYSPKELENIDFSKMTVKEVMEKQKDGELLDRDFFAVGRYQFIPKTLKEAFEWASKKGLVSEDDKFNASTQDKLFEYLISKEKRPNLNAYLSGKSMDKAKAMEDLAKEWASIPVMQDTTKKTKKGSKKIKKGSSYYSDGVNKAHIKTSQVEDLFKDIDNSLLYDYKPFPSELLEGPDFVKPDNKEESFFKKLIEKEPQKEIKEKKKSYDDMKFSEAFEQAFKDKGEGGIFDYKGKKILLKRAEPKKETKSFKDIISEYSSKEPEPMLEELEEPVELDYGGNELMDREKELEELLKKQAAYKDGGVRNKYELGGLGKDEEEEPKDPNIVSYLDSGSDNTTDSVTEKDTEDLAIDTPEINTEASLEELPEAKPLAMEKPEEAGFMDKLGSMFSSEEEPKKEQKPLTMKSLEERYNQLMEADAKERQTAGWATAAMHIASLIDKASAEPIGITPINFQAGDSRAQMQNLLAMGKMKGLGADPSSNWKLTTIEDEQGRPVTYRINPNTGEKEKVGIRGYSNTLVKDPETGLLIDKRELLRDDKKSKESAKDSRTFYQNLNPNQRKQFLDSRKNFEKETEKQRSSYDELDGIKSAVDSAMENEVSAAQLGARVANVFENGRLTDEDVLRYTRRNSIPSRIVDTFKLMKSGTITKDKADEIKETLEVYKAALTEKLQEKLMEQSENFSIDYGIPVEEAAKHMYPKYFNKVGVKGEKSNKLSGDKKETSSEYSPQIETKIQRVMDANPSATREQIIKALKAKGKL